MKKLVPFLTLFFIGMLANTAKAYEEPEYSIVKQTDLYQIRFYKERLVVQTVSNEDNNGFRRLFGYISGDNSQQQEIAMTIPVTQSSSQGENLMRFFLPAKYSLDSVPTPINEQVQISLLPSVYLAVITYSGFASTSNFVQHSEELVDALTKDQIAIVGKPIRATYNSPFTLPFLRRNEAMIEVDWRPSKD